MVADRLVEGDQVYDAAPLAVSDAAVPLHTVGLLTVTVGN